jgi:hypothetical protein
VLLMLKQIPRGRRAATRASTRQSSWPSAATSEWPHVARNSGRRGGSAIAMHFLQGFGAKDLVVFPPSRTKAGQDVDAGFRAMCQGFNRIGEAANKMGFKAGVYNHLGEMVQGPEEVDRCMELTDPRLFNFAPILRTSIWGVRTW